MESLGKPDDPCAAEGKAYEEALREWTRLDAYAQGFATTKPLRFDEDVKPIPIEELANAYRAAAEAKRIYEERERTFFECRKRHPVNRGQGP